MTLTYEDRQHLKRHIDAAVRYRVSSHRGKMLEARRIMEALDNQIVQKEPVRWRQRMWDAPALIHLFQQVAREMGKQPTKKDWSKRPDCPPEGVYFSLFGSWNGLVKAAGFKVYVGKGPNKQPAWTKQMMADIWREYTAIHKRQPTLRDWIDFARPSATTLRRLFGTWNNYVKEMGGTPIPGVVPPKEKT